MATGSGKTLIMAANILYLYRLGYRNFIFFVNSTNIIEKTKDNFLNSLSEKYLFAPKIKFGDLPAEASAQAGIAKTKIKYKFIDFGENIIRGALDKFEFYRFDNLKKYFPHLKSVYEFISSPNYLGNIEIEISGPKEKINLFACHAQADKLTPIQKLKIALFIVREIADQARTNTSEFVGTTLFKARMLKDVFRDKILKIDSDDERAKGTQDINLSEKDWYAQNELYGTSEEQEFINFIDGFIEKLRQKYSDIALLRNEKFFQVFDFDEGRPFEPDFIMILKKRNKVISIYQIFIEPKGGWTYDMNKRFELSQEGWKQKFLLEIENKADTDLKFENKYFKLMGLPFYNKTLEKEFEEALENKILK